MATPRPRPPAKVRKSPSLNFPPPPPYAPRLDVLLASPIGVTTQLLGSAVSEEPSDAPNHPAEEWMNEKSKEELSGLLLKADGLIKERETGMYPRCAYTYMTLSLYRTGLDICPVQDIVPRQHCSQNQARSITFPLFLPPLQLCLADNFGFLL